VISVHPISRSSDHLILFGVLKTVNIALFGGTFDPIHAGHVQAACAAARKFRLDRVLFIPAGNPPHKYRDHLTPFPQRYGMVVLACAGDQRLIPSLLEAPTPDGKPRYSIDTVRKVHRSLRKSDRLFFLIGVDAFLDLPCWKEYRRLLDSVDFLVVSRPGFDANEIRKVVPAAMIRSGGAPHHPLLPSSVRRGLGGGAGRPEVMRLRRSTLNILRGVHMPVASHDIRKAIASGRRVTGLVPPLVEEYILKEGLYRPRRGGTSQR
jgi:nicotinate-nucleotide adenylyltransferase